MEGSRSLGALIGRILLTSIFVLSGFSKITNFGGTAGYMAGAGIPKDLIAPALVLTILIEFGGGLLIMLGLRTRLVALVMLLWFIPVTIVFHLIPYRQATAEGQAMIAMNQMINLLKNISIMGGLIFVASMGAGGYSIDGRGASSGAAPSRRAA
jgi:putative oxidoreductase